MKRALLIFVTAAVAASLLHAHELFIKLDTYFLGPDSPVTVRIHNGTFAESENWITRDRIADISVVSSGRRVRVDTSSWSPTADSLTSLLALRTGAPGTYVIGVSTKPRDIHLEAEAFNDYLEHEGIPDVLEDRRRGGHLDRDAWERYAKHVKAIAQVGDARSRDFNAVFGYPAEIVALVNPYTLAVGGRMRVRALVNGRPVHRQLVIVGGEGRDGPIDERSLRSDADGAVGFAVTAAGKWYVKFINMVRVEGQDELDYVSEWATLTFEVR